MKEEIRSSPDHIIMYTGAIELATVLHIEHTHSALCQYGDVAELFDDP